MKYKVMYTAGAKKDLLKIRPANCAVIYAGMPLKKAILQKALSTFESAFC